MQKIVAFRCRPRSTWNTVTLVCEAAKGPEVTAIDLYKLGPFVGPTKILISSDTLQFKDYSRYSWTTFDPEAKKARHEAVLPEDKKKAFALGEQMASGTRK